MTEAQTGEKTEVLTKKDKKGLELTKGGDLRTEDGAYYDGREVFMALAKAGTVELDMDDKGNLTIGDDKVTMKFISEDERLMSLTCWGSLSYCCSIEKPCERRDKILESIGLTKRDFESIKSSTHLAFLKIAETKRRNSEQRDEEEKEQEQ